MRARFAMVLLAVSCVGTRAPGQSAAVAPAERAAAPPAAAERSAPDSYAAWMAQYQNGVFVSPAGEHHPIVLAVRIVSGDLALDPTIRPFAITKNIITTLELSTAGTVSMIRTLPFEVQGGGPDPIPAADFRRLTQLMMQLPDDDGWLPPNGRRLVIQVDTGSGYVARVYDRANLPQRAIEIADLMGADTWPLYDFPRFEPDGRWKEVPGKGEGAFDGRVRAEPDPGDEVQSMTYSPDGSKVAIVTAHSDSVHGYSVHLRIWDVGTGRLLHELLPLEGRPRDGFGRPLWWPDGKYLFALTRDGHFGGDSIIGIWNTESGRYRGGLTGCPVLADPSSWVVLRNGEFTMNCQGEVLMWRGDRIVEKIADFERSLMR